MSSYTRTESITLPRGIDGTYYVHVISDPLPIPDPRPFGPTLPVQSSNSGNWQFYTDHVYEGWACELRDCGGPNEFNNLATVALDVTYREPDLRILGVEVPAEAIYSSDRFDVSWTVVNEGTRETRETRWIDRVYLSRDPSLDDQDLLLATARQAGGVLAAAETYEAMHEVRLPDGISGPYYILAFTDSYYTEGPRGLTLDGAEFGTQGRVPEFADEANNVLAAAIAVTLREPPDLRVTQVTIPQRVNVGQQLDVSWQVTNQGTGDTPDEQTRWTDHVYLSRDEFLDTTADRYLGNASHSGGLTRGQSYNGQSSFRVPAGYAGPYYVIVATDAPSNEKPRGQVFEQTNEGNNATPSSQPLIIEVPPPSDLQVTSISIPSSAKVGDPLTISWTVTNAHDDNSAEGRWSDAAYLSSDNVWDIGDIPLGRAAITQPDGLAPGASYTASLNTTSAADRTGTVSRDRAHGHLERDSRGRERGQ